MTNLKRASYPKYVASGDIWGQVMPSHWSLEPNKSFLKIEKDVVGEKSKDMQLLSLSLKGVILRDKDSGEGKFPESFDTYQSVAPGDLIFCLFDVDETPRTVGLSEHHGMITGAYTIMRTNHKAFPKYIYYYYYHHDIQKSLKPYYSGLRKVVTKDLFKSIKIPLPPLDEQKAISHFLDVETEKIDRLIKKQEKLIALIGEKRKALINQVVTRGLDPNAPMKDSGNLWVGFIPKGWSFKCLKYLTTCNDDVLPESTDKNYEIEYVEVGDVSELEGIKSTTTVCFGDSASRARRLVRSGDIIISTVRTYLRAIASITNPPKNLVVSTGFAVIRPQHIDQDFAKYALSSEYFMAEVVSRSTGISYPAINSSELVNIKIAVPPLEEQRILAAYLNKKFDSLNRLMKRAQDSISLLREHRASLISASVTGKIDVRNLS